MDDEIDNAGVDVGEPVVVPRALASACERADRYEAADAMAVSEDAERFLNMDGVCGFGTAMGEGCGDGMGMATTRTMAHSTLWTTSRGVG